MLLVFYSFVFFSAKKSTKRREIRRNPKLGVNVIELFPLLWTAK